MKAIVIIRTSTEAQEVESQKTEIVNYAKSCGYNDIVVIGGHASAIKLDTAYKQNLAEVYKQIETGTVDCVFAWAIDRIGRNEEVLMQFKNYLISKKVNLVIKNPTLSLLNPDGTVNSGVELAFSLFCTMAKQEMEQKKERFRRAKLRNAQQSRYNGGLVRFGYTLVDGKFEPDPVDAETVRLAFNLYASGQYTCLTLAKELNERGSNKHFNVRAVSQLLKSTAYIGYSGQYVYPAIISEELFNDVANKMKVNNWSKQTKRFNLCSNLIVCPVCNSHFAANTKLYRCWKHSAQEGDCPNKLSISIEALDSLVWYLTGLYYYEILKNEKDKAASEIELLNQKIDHLQAHYDTFLTQMEKVQAGYEDGIYSKEKRDARIMQIKQKMKAEMDVINGYKEQIQRLQVNPEVSILELETMPFNEKYKLVKRIVKEIQLLDVETIQVKFYNYPDIIVKYYRYVNRHYTDWYVNKFFINDKPISLQKIKKP